MKRLDDFIRSNDTLMAMRDIYNIIHDYQYEKYFRKFDSYLDKIHNMHYKKRCFLIATGPSLNKTNLKLIKDEICFSVNTFFNGMDKFGVYPSYWVIVDGKVLKEHCKKFSELNTSLFIASSAAIEFCKNFNKYKKIFEKIPILIRRNGALWYFKKFPINLKKGTWWGGSVTIQTLQIIFHMGFKEVYLLGCDCNYLGAHHFDGKCYNFQYDGVKGKEFIDKDRKRWSITFESYKICKKTFENDGRKIYNATVGGKLEIFERKSLEKIFDEKKEGRKKYE